MNQTQMQNFIQRLRDLPTFDEVEGGGIVVNSNGYGEIVLRENLQEIIEEMISKMEIESEHTAIADSIPGVDGFTVAVFRSNCVPPGTKVIADIE